MEGAFLRTSQPSTSVSDAALGCFLPSSPERQQLLIPRGAALQIWSTDGMGGLELVGETVVRERVEAVRTVPRGGDLLDAVLLLTSDHVATLSAWDASEGGLRPLATQFLAVFDEDVQDGRPPAVPRLAGAYLSEGHSMCNNGVSSLTLFAAALVEGFIHFVFVPPDHTLHFFSASCEQLRASGQSQSAQGLCPHRPAHAQLKHTRRRLRIQQS
jgi:hypothetical protein